MKIYRSEQYQQQLWKNGRGVTREIARYPASGEFQWRISMADIVESGAFSQFVGVERILVLLEGEPVYLQTADLAPKRLELFDAWKFPGDVTTHAVVSASGRDFNVMTHRESFSAECVIHRLNRGASVHVENGFLFCAAGAVSTGTDVLQRFDTAHMDSSMAVFSAVEDSIVISVKIKEKNHV